MTPDERFILNEVAASVAKVRNALVSRCDYHDVRILEKVINELATVLENDMDRKQNNNEMENKLST